MGIDIMSVDKEQAAVADVFLNAIPIGLSKNQRKELLLKAEELKKTRRIDSSHLKQIKRKLDERVVAVRV